MWTTTKKTGQSIIVGDATVTILGVNDRGQVRVGVQAPRSVTVHSGPDNRSKKE